MVCKQCGESLDERERFCPHCGSYFIDRDTDESSRLWRGVIRADGSLVNQAEVKEVHSSGRSLTWGILSMIGTALLIVINILGFFVGIDAYAAGVAIFAFDIVALKKAKGYEYIKWSFLMLIIAVVLFIVEVVRD